MSEFDAKKARAKHGMPIWVDAFTRETMHLNHEQVGSYMLLLMAMWSRRDLELNDNEHQLATICRASRVQFRRKIWPTLSEFFVVANGKVTHKRAKKEAEFVEKYLAKQSARKRENKSDKPLETMEPPPTADEPRMNHGKSTDASVEDPTQQPNNPIVDSVTVVTGADAPIDATKEAIWKRGIPFLCERGVPEREARSLVGKWLRDAGADSLFDALKAAAAAKTGDPVPYITEALKPAPDVAKLVAEATERLRIAN